MAGNQESILARLNKLVTALPTRNLDQYIVGEIVSVVHLKRVNTTYGSKIVMNSEDFSTFLPGKMNDMSDQDIQDYNSLKNLLMCYMGKIKNVHTITFKQNEIGEFYTSFYAPSDIQI